MPNTILILVGFALLVAIGGYFAWQAAKKRREELAAFARRHDLHFDPDRDRGHDSRYPQFDVFRQGDDRYAYNTVSGTVELFGRRCELRCGDYHYEETSGTGKDRKTSTYHFSYLLVRMPWHTPPLLVRAEGFFDKVAGALGFDDIDFESVEFSRAFYVKSSDRRFAYDVLHPRMMEFLLAERPPKIEVADGAFCLSDGSRRWQPERFEANLEFVTRFCELWPRHLLKDLNG